MFNSRYIHEFLLAVGDIVITAMLVSTLAMPIVTKREPMIIEGNIPLGDEAGTIFGNTGIGSTDMVIALRTADPMETEIIQCLEVVLDDTYDVNNMYACLSNTNTGRVNVNCAIYDSDKNVVATTTGQGVDPLDEDVWYNFSFSSTPTLEAGTYYLAVLGDSPSRNEYVVSIAGENSGSNTSIYKEYAGGGQYPTFEDPLSSYNTDTSSERSIYISCTLNSIAYDHTSVYPTNIANDGWDDSERLADGNRATFATSTDNGDQAILRAPINVPFYNLPNKPVDPDNINLDVTGYYLIAGTTSQLNVTISWDAGDTWGDTYEIDLDSDTSETYEIDISGDSAKPANLTWYDIENIMLNCEAYLVGGARIGVSYVGVNISHDYWTQPLINRTIPFDGQRNVSTSLSQVSITLNSTKGNFNYSIEGDFLTNTDDQNVGDGTYTADINSLSDNTDYIWYVNVSDYDDSQHYTANYVLYFNTKDISDYDMLILTDDDNYSLALDFKNWKEGNSTYTCKIENLSDINSESWYHADGCFGDNNTCNHFYEKSVVDPISDYNDSQAHARNCVRDYHINHGISYVYIVGGLFPYKMMRTFELPFIVPNINRPSDTLWYGMLNGSQKKYNWFDSWGWRNMTTTQTNGLTDTEMDVIVGRNIGYNSDEIGYIIDKTKNYEAIPEDDIFCKTYCFYSESLAAPYNDSDDAWTNENYGLNNSDLGGIRDYLTFVNGSGVAPGQIGQFDNCITQEQVNDDLLGIMNCSNDTHPHGFNIYHYYTHTNKGYNGSEGYWDSIKSLTNNSHPYIQPPFGCNQGDWVSNDTNYHTSAWIMRQKGGSVVLTGSTSTQVGSGGFLTFFNDIVDNSTDKTLGEIWEDYYIEWCSTNQKMMFNQFNGDPTLYFNGVTPDAPWIHGENPPSDNSFRVASMPICNVTVTQNQSVCMNVTWQSNYSDGETWVTYQINESVESDSIVYWSFDGASAEDTKYWWRVYADDGIKNVSNTFCFTTREWKDDIYDFTMSGLSSANREWKDNEYTWTMSACDIREWTDDRYHWSMSAYSPANRNWNEDQYHMTYSALSSANRVWNDPYHMSISALSTANREWKDDQYHYSTSALSTANREWNTPYHQTYSALASANRNWEDTYYMSMSAKNTSLRNWETEYHYSISALSSANRNWDDTYYQSFSALANANRIWKDDIYDFTISSALASENRIWNNDQYFMTTSALSSDNREWENTYYMSMSVKNTSIRSWETEYYQTFSALSSEDRTWEDTYHMTISASNTSGRNWNSVYYYSISANNTGTRQWNNPYYMTISASNSEGRNWDDPYYMSISALNVAPRNWNNQYYMKISALSGIEGNWKSKYYWSMSASSNANRNWDFDYYYSISACNSETRQWNDQIFYSISASNTSIKNWEDTYHYSMSASNISLRTWQEQYYMTMSARSQLENKWNDKYYHTMSASNHSIRNWDDTYYMSMSAKNIETAQWHEDQYIWTMNASNTSLRTWDENYYWSMSASNPGVTQWTDRYIWKMSASNHSIRNWDEQYYMSMSANNTGISQWYDNQYHISFSASNTSINNWEDKYYFTINASNTSLRLWDDTYYYSISACNQEGDQWNDTYHWTMSASNYSVRNWEDTYYMTMSANNTGATIWTDQIYMIISASNSSINLWNNTYYWTMNASNTTTRNWASDYYYSMSASNSSKLGPIYGTPTPTNQSRITNTGPTFMIQLNDTYTTFNWTIETIPDVGNNSANSDTNGTKTLTLTSLSYTTYTIWVNITDGHYNTQRWYTFTTYSGDTSGNIDYHVEGETAYVNPTLGDGVTDYKLCIKDTDGGESETIWINSTELQEHRYHLDYGKNYVLTLFYRNNSLLKSISKKLNMPNDPNIKYDNEGNIITDETSEETDQPSKYHNIFEKLKINNYHLILFILIFTVIFVYIFQKEKKKTLFKIIKKKNYRRKKKK